MAINGNFNIQEGDSVWEIRNPLIGIPLGLKSHRVDVLKVGGCVPVRQEVDLEENIIFLVSLIPAPSTSFLLAGKTSRLS